MNDKEKVGRILVRERGEPWILVGRVDSMDSLCRNIESYVREAVDDMENEDIHRLELRRIDMTDDEVDALPDYY